VASTILLTIGTSGEGIRSSLLGAEKVGGASSLANIGVSVANSLSGGFSSIGNSAVGGDQGSTAVQAFTVGLTISSTSSNTSSVGGTIETDSTGTNRLKGIQTSIVNSAIGSSGGARTTNTTDHAVLSRVTITVIGTRLRVSTNTSGGIANHVVTHISSSAVGIRGTEDTTSVVVTVRSIFTITSTGSVSKTVRSSRTSSQLTVSVGGTGSATSGRTDGRSEIGNSAKTMSRNITENARDTSSLPTYDGSSFDLVHTIAISGNIEVNH
jgi:hypothetical protein